MGSAHEDHVLLLRQIRNGRKLGEGLDMLVLRFHLNREVSSGIAVSGLDMKSFV